MKTCILLLVLAVGIDFAKAQDYRAPSTTGNTAPAAAATSSGAAPSVPKAEGDFTLGEQSVGNVSELVKKVEEQNTNAKKRIEEIDAYVNPILGDTASKLFGVRPDEFLFLMRQSLARRSPAIFNKQRSADNQTTDGILDYFEKAYSAIRAKEFWYGREESLVPLDAQLYQIMKTDVLAAIAKRPDGDRIQSMLTERETLLSRLNSNLPLFNYLTERREWWKTYPDYVKAVEEESKGVDAEVNRGGWGGGPGGGRQGGGFGGGAGGRGGGGRGR